MKIVVDAMGGDHAPGVVVDGAIAAVRELGVEVLLTGPAEIVQRELASRGAEKLIEVRHASEIVGMDEHPAAAVRRKRDSSIRVGLELVASGGADAFVSAGNTGAVMATATLVLKRTPGVERPGILTHFPTITGEPALLIDAGANVDCKAVHLAHFGVMGSVYAQAILGRPSPSVGVLSNGEEEGKGNDLTREVDQLLRGTSLRYVGYVEGRDLFNGRVDVVVCDGFVGNVALKASEGVAGAIRTLLERGFRASLRGKLAYLLARPVLRDMKKAFDHHEYGGAPLLGVQGVCIISHGSATAYAIRNAIRLAQTQRREDVTTRIERALGEARILPGLDKPATGDRVVFLKELAKKMRIPRRGAAPVETPAPIRAALVCPGQGSEFVGMGAELAARHALVRDTIREASDAAGIDLATLMVNGPIERLRLTEHAQPAIVALSVAVARLVQAELALKPAIVLGHSVGEYAALVLAGSVAFADAIRLLRERGKLMHDASPPGRGSMAVVAGLARAQLTKLAQDTAQGAVLEITDEQGPEQFVISGDARAVDRAVDAATALGVKRATLLPVTAPFHSSLMTAAAERFASALAGLAVRDPEITLLSSASGGRLTSTDEIRAALLAQVTGPVHWFGAARQLVDAAPELVVEVGPGSFLTGALRRIEPRLRVASVDDLDGLKALREAVQRLLTPR